MNACTKGKCVCPPNKSGIDCSETNPCFGTNGWICIGGSSVLCYNNAAAKSFSCANGCNVSELLIKRIVLIETIKGITGQCKCLNDCTGNGRCIFDGISGNSTCSCFEEFYGNDCSLNNPCATNTHNTFCYNKYEGILDFAFY